MQLNRYLSGGLIFHLGAVALLGRSEGRVEAGGPAAASEAIYVVEGGSLEISTGPLFVDVLEVDADFRKRESSIFLLTPGQELRCGRDGSGDLTLLGELTITPGGASSTKQEIERVRLTIGADGVFEAGEDRPAGEPTRIEHAKVILNDDTGELVVVSSDLQPSDRLAAMMGLRTASDRSAMRAKLKARVVLVQGGPVSHPSPDEPVVTRAAENPPGQTAGAIGPDLILKLLNGIDSYGVAPDPVTQELTASFAIATFACNIGDENALWYEDDNRHPVIAQNMYRLKDNRFEHIGMSWLKHGFFAVNQSGVCPECQSPFPPGQNDGYLLGVGCADPYSANLNGQQTNLGPRSQVNPYTGYFPFPFYGRGVTPLDKLSRRLMVRDVDLDPALNGDALYFVEGHYVTSDDAAAGNGANNTAYRPIARAVPTHPFTCRHLPDGDASQRCFAMQGSTRAEQPAIAAWRENDPSVVLTEINVPEAPEPATPARMFLAAKATELNDGYWHYEYAMQNINSDRAASSFVVPVPPAASVRNIGFHDVFYHSGTAVIEAYDGTDWAGIRGTDEIVWSTTPYVENANANALRWGTLYNFRFEANVPPQPSNLIVGLFKPVSGLPSQFTAASLAPAPGLVDCNNNQIADSCDVDCDAPSCGAPCGDSLDCNENNVPDECEDDCNNNNVADGCDISGGTSLDCNLNGVPDDCEPDCDDDGIPDVCETDVDCDEDGVLDCDDECPCTTPAGACSCPEYGVCCLPSGICIPGYLREDCIDLGGTPDCLGALCRDGCLLGDFDRDGDRDFGDTAAFAVCFSGEFSEQNFSQPAQECRRPFDYDNDTDVDLNDWADFIGELGGPPAE